MEDNLVIVESPAKAKTIEKFLGKNFLVKSSFGHIRDLAKKNLGIDIENSFKPQYEIASDKKKVVAELKKLVKSAKTVWLASDEDREGEAIAWHLSEVLNLSEDNTKRIVFNEITKDAILNAIKKPRNINKAIVDAQQARRVLDRLVGFELSPLLWKKIKPSLSAGRVQSVAVRLIVERERSIMNFKDSSSYKVYATFVVTAENNSPIEFRAELPVNLKTQKEALEFLEQCKGAEFKVVDVNIKPTIKSPSPPFTTSTLQQEASRKLGFSVSQTMSIAQRLYEAGKITYMRTDSVNLSKLAIATAKNEIISEFGEKYLKSRQFSTKAKGAQEAHEAIRPTYIDKHTVTGNKAEKRLYELIWKRTIASQMSEAQFEKTNVDISISTSDKKLVATGEVLKFDGFLKVYIESTDDNGNDTPKGLLPKLQVNDKLPLQDMKGVQKFAHHAPRYTEASLVRKLEELGIGRPSTYAPIISTVQNRNYVIKEDRQGNERKYNVITLSNDKIKEEDKVEIAGAEKSKLFPTDIGMVVNDFLVEHFESILDYNFTAKVEKEFDDIANGLLPWEKMIDNFYGAFHKKVEVTMETSSKNKGERNLGTDPASGKSISVKIGRYGPIAQLGETDDEQKPRFASLRKGQHLETITLEDAIELFKLPRDVGEFEDKIVVVAIGKFGPYARHDSSFYSLAKTDDPLKVEIDRVIEIILEKREKEKQKYIKSFDQDEDMKVLNGRWGPYISYQKANYKISKKDTPEDLTYEDCLRIIEEGQKAKEKKKK